MTRHARILLLFIILGLTALTAGRAVQAEPTDIGSTSAIERPMEPVIVEGSTAPAFHNTSVRDLFVYVYQDEEWIQIPAQVDEITSEGAYTVLEDGLLDENDEIVFMAGDLGVRAVDTVPAVDGTPIGVHWYEIEVTDPTDSGQTGWAYLVRSSALERTFTTDYVSFAPALHRIIGQTYRLGFATPQPWMNYLALGDSDVDILDRSKTRLYCNIPIICPITEARSPDLEDGLIKDGPVRLLVRNGRVQAYGSMAMWDVSVPEILPGDLRFSTDFNAAVSGSTFYNAGVPDGVPVDGEPDTVPASPLSPWWQLSTDMGTLIQVSDTSPIGGDQTNYYVDDSNIDNTDTGDRRHYADTGVYITNPNTSFAYSFNIYFLAESQPNVGETYAAYFANPLSATATLQQLDLPVKVYLPVVMRTQ